MDPLSPAEQGLFRISLFFGPDRVAGDEGHWRCVFNVKKRSWKGGVQVSVDISDAQAQRLHARLHAAAWTSDILEKIPEDERQVWHERIHDAFLQTLCARKLDLALQSGLEQQNQEIPAEVFIDELDQLARVQSERIFAALRTELDLDDHFHSIP
jgi:hypothetical protein